MRSNETVASAIFAAGLLIYSVTAATARADAACEAAPTPECVLDLAHASTELIEGPATKARTLIRIAVAEAAAGYREQAESSLALAQLIADGPGLADGISEFEYGPKTEDEVRAILDREIFSARARIGTNLAALTKAIDEAENLEYRLMLSYMAAEALIDTGRRDEARTVVDRLLSGLDQNDDAEQVMTLRASVAMMYARMEDFGAALNLALQLPDNHTQLMKQGILIQIAAAQRVAGDEAGAQATLTAVEQTIPGIENTEMREMATNMLTSMRPREEYPQETTAPNVGNCPADLSPYGVAVDKAKFGYFTEALELAMTLEDPDRRENAISRIASLQVQQGYLDDAYNTVLMIGDPLRRELATHGLVRAYAKAGNAAGARMAAQTIPNASERDTALGLAIDPLVAAGNLAGAAEIIRDMPDPDRRANAYAELAQSILDAEARAGEEAGVETDGEAQEPG